MGDNMKKPSVFANKIDKDLTNNEKVFNSANKKEVELERTAKVDVNAKIKEIFSSPHYVYKADTIIKTKDGVLNKRIVGKNGDKLLTIDNEFIEVKDILDIELKK